MAGKKGKVQIAVMECPVCRRRNYRTGRNVVNVTTKLTLNKFCAGCRKHTAHKETK
jgi:large subunit ribosomal protein L33